MVPQKDKGEAGGVVTMKLVDSVVRRFEVARIFPGNARQIKNMDFSAAGDRLISCTADDQIVIYDCENGTQLPTVNSKKYGVDLVRFTQARNTAIHSSSKLDNTIRYLSLQETKYIRYFSGHSQPVVSLCISPVEDIFLSASVDGSLRLWDLRIHSCQSTVRVPGHPVAAYHPGGLVIAAGVSSKSIELFDLRTFDKGPFNSFIFARERGCDWTDLKFSEDSKSLLISTNGSVVRLFDAEKGDCLQTFSGYLNDKSIPIEASFSPDSQYVFSGSTNAKVHVWNANTGNKVGVLNSHHPKPVQCVQFNPSYMMLASACTNMAFWLPTRGEMA